MKDRKKMEEAKKDGKRWLFAKILVFSMFIKTPGSFPANSLKRNCFYFLGRKNYK